MTSNLLVYVFYALFFIFLVESIYYLKKKLSIGQVELSSEQYQQNSGKWALTVGIIVIVMIITISAFLLISRLKVTPKPNTSNINPTAFPTQIILSPTPNQVVYNFPTVTGLLPSPTLVILITVTPARIPQSSTTLPSPTTKPSPTSLPTPTPTIKATLTPHPTNNPTPTLVPTRATSSPTKVPPIGGPLINTPVINQVSPTSALVIVPKMPVSGSIQQTLTIFVLGLSTIITGLFL